MSRPRSPRNDAFSAVVARLDSIEGLTADDRHRAARLLRKTSRLTAKWDDLDREVAAQMLELLAVLPTTRDFRTRIRGYGELARLLRLVKLREMFGGPVKAIPRGAMWNQPKDAA